MKKILNISFFIFSFSLLLAACTRDAGGDEREGYGSLDLGSITHSIAEAGGSEDGVETRAQIFPNTNDYSVKVWRLGAEGEVVVDRPYSECTGTIELYAGTYMLEVASPGLQGAAFDAPWYVGRKEIVIRKGETTPIGDIVCRLGNVKVTVRYSEALQALLDMGTAHVTVSVGENSLGFHGGDMRSGYLSVSGAASVTIGVSFEGVVDGENMTTSGEFTASPGQWRRVRLTTEETGDERTGHIIVFGSEIGQIGDGGAWF